MLTSEVGRGLDSTPTRLWYVISDRYPEVDPMAGAVNTEIV